MNLQELKAKLVPIVCDSNLTGSMRTALLSPICGEWLEANPDLTVEEVFDQWNNTMADIVIENGLGRQ